MKGVWQRCSQPTPRRKGASVRASGHDRTEVVVARADWQGGTAAIDLARSSRPGHRYGLRRLRLTRGAIVPTSKRRGTDLV